MDIHLLKTFVAAYEEANFTKAARRLNATQPGVSVQIATLEASVCTPLFERNARSVTPTEAGRRLYPRALQLIHDFNSTTQEIRALAGSVAGRVAIGIPPTLSRAIVPPILGQYLAAYPQSDVRVVELPADALLALIHSRELDFAFVTPMANQAAMAERRVCCDRVILASGRLSGVKPGRPVHLDGESRFKIVVPSLLRQALSSVLDDPLRPGGRIVPERLIEMDSLACTLELVAMTDWVALLPAAAACNQPKGLDVRFTEIGGDEITIEYSVVHARTEPPSTAAEAFIDLAAAELNRVAARWRQRVSVKAPRPLSSQAPGEQRLQPARNSSVPQRDIRSNIKHPGASSFVLRAAVE